MNIDGITLQCITKELQKELTGGQITKIYQPRARTLYFRIFSATGLHHVIITLDESPRIYIAEKMPPMPDTPSALCMFLRKYYENGRISSLRQLHLDRLLEIDVDILNVSGTLVTRKIHVELMGKYSNVIFTEDGIILEALIKTGHHKTALRTIAPKEPYGFPPNFMRMDPFAFCAEELSAFMTPGEEEELGKWMLQRFNGISTVVLRELSYRTGIDYTRSVDTLSDSERFAWCRAVERFGQELTNITGIYVYTREKKDILFPLALDSLQNLPHCHLTDIQTYLNTYQQQQGSLNGEQEELKKQVGKRIEKQKKKIRRMTAEIKETEKMDLYKLYGDLLMIHAYLPWHHETQITVPDLLSETQEPLSIPLHPAYSLTDNANRYYKKYTKLRRRKEMSQSLYQENETFLHYLYSLEYALETVTDKEEIEEVKAEMRQTRLLSSGRKERSKKESCRQIQSVTVDGMQVYIGHNNRQNDFLTGKKAHPYDLWFHAKNLPGSHVVLACHGQTPTPRQIERTAQIAAYYSKGRNAAKVEVDAALIKHVKKPPHAAPGFVLFTHQQTYRVSPQAPATDDK